MDFVIRLPIEIDADEVLILNRKKLLLEWNLPSPCVTLWKKEELISKETVICDIEEYFKKLVKLIHSLYVSSLTEKDVYLALAYKKKDYDNINCYQVNKKNDLETLYNIYSQYSLNIPFYNPLIMIKTLLQLKHIFKMEMNSTKKPLQEEFKIDNFHENYVFLLDQCLRILMITLENILKPSIEDVSNLNLNIDSTYFNKIIDDFVDSNGNPLISVKKLGIGVHPDQGRGFFSTEDIEADTNLIEISLSCTLSFYTALYSEDFGYIARYLSNPTHYLSEMKSPYSNLDINNNKDQEIILQPIDHDSILLLFTIYQTYLGEKSKWNNVISLWQDPKDPNNQNLYMAPKEVIDFLSHGGNDFNTRINNNIDELYSLLNHVHYLLNLIKNEANNLSKRHNNQQLSNSILFFKNLDYLNIFTWKSFNQIKYVLDTRSFSVKWWPINNKTYKYNILKDTNKLIIQSPEDENNSLELIYIPTLDFTKNGEYTNFLLPVPTEGIRTILPIADMFNHSYLAPCSSPYLDHENNRFIIRNEINIPKNTQVFIRYGILTTNECLYAYGFIPKTKPVSGLFDTLTLNLEPEDDDPLYKIKMLLLKHSNIPTEHIFAKLSTQLTNIELLYKCIDIVTSSDPISTLKNWDKKTRKSKRYSVNYSRIISEILENILKPCIKNYNLLIKYKLSLENSRPFWFSEWGERSTEYYSNQIELIKLSLEKFKKTSIDTDKFSF